MQTLLTTQDYDFAVNRLVELMNFELLSITEKEELSDLLDLIDQYNGMEFLKVREN